jgi:hypothetical protein
LTFMNHTPVIQRSEGKSCTAILGRGGIHGG